jgi:hypothetical protein
MLTGVETAFGAVTGTGAFVVGVVLATGSRSGVLAATGNGASADLDPGELSFFQIRKKISSPATATAARPIGTIAPNPFAGADCSGSTGRIGGTEALGGRFWECACLARFKASLIKLIR